MCIGVSIVLLGLHDGYDEVFSSLAQTIENIFLMASLVSDEDLYRFCSSNIEFYNADSVEEDTMLLLCSF